MRVFLFIVLACTALLSPLWFFLICALCYALWKPAYELIFLAVLIDAQFGLYSAGFPYLYTVLTGGLVLILEYVKPNLTFYEA